MSKCMNGLFDFGTIHGIGFKIMLVLKYLPRLKLERHNSVYSIFQHGVIVFVNTLVF